MKKILFASVIGIVLLAVFGISTASAQTTSTVVKFTVQLRNNVSVQLGATVISNTQDTGNASIIVLNGTSQTAKTFTALAQSLLASNAGVSKMILLDHPGHGNSGYPTGSGGVLFGDLNMDDYVTALLGALKKFRPTAVMGHSLGAEITLMAQTRLVRSGKTMKSEFGTRAAIFLVPDIPAPLPWVAIDAGAADPLASIFVRSDPALGNVFDLLTHPAGPATFLQLFYANNLGMLPPGTPTPAQAVANGFISLESGAMVSQLIGLPSTPGGPRNPRPTIDANIFAPSRGTRAGLITLEQDGSLYAFPTEHRNIYRYATGDQNDRLFFTFSGPLTVHNLHTITPGLYNGVIKRILEASEDGNAQ